MQNLRTVVGTLILALLALGGTVFYVPLFFGVDVLFGSVFVFIALRRLGPLSGLLVALAAGAYTLVLWGHPYALIVLVAEAGAVLFFQRRQSNGTLPQWVILFWLFCGLPFIALTYHFLLGVPWLGTGLVAFKQAVNEVFNALIAALLLQYLPRWGFLRHLTKYQRGVHALQMDLLLAFAFVPVMVVMTLNARFTVDNTLTDIQQRIGIRATNLASQIAAWREDHWMRLQALANLGEEIRLRDLQLLKHANPEMLFVHVVDLEGRIRLTTNEDSQAISQLNLADRPWFQEVLATRKPVVSDAILGRSTHQLSVVLAVPILQSGRVTGIVATAATGESLLRRVTAGYQTAATGRITLVDGSGLIIGSTEPSFKPMERFAQRRGGLVKDRNWPYYRLQPTENLAAMQAWFKSFYVIESNKDLDGWTLVVEQPMGPYAEELQKSYLAMFAATFFLAAVVLWLSTILGRVVSGPLRLLSQATSSFGQSTIDPALLRLPESGIAEVASLANDFRLMALRLHEQRMALQRANDELESRVVQRTIELQQRQNAMDEHAIVSMADPAGAITYVNDKFVTISGYSRKELLGQNHRLLKSGYHPPSFFSEMWDTISHGRPWHGQVCNRAKDGRLYWVASTIVPFVDASGVPVQYISIRTDITDIKETEEALVRARDEAESASQAKSQFLSSMSHELRTPMNAILGFAQLLELDEGLNPEQRDGVLEIRKAGDHLLALINEVLDLAKVESGSVDLSLEPVELAPVVQECLGLVTPLAQQRDIRIESEECEDVVVRADRTRLKQAMLNLISNAIKYNRPGGQVRIQVRRSGDRQLRITVTDTGMGIPADKLDQLFVPFSRLGHENSVIEGTGIGLTLTKRMVEMMGGQVGVESSVNGGSTFWIELPDERDAIAPADGLGAAAAGGEVVRAADDRQYLVLYIEDNPANLRLVAQILGTRAHIHLLTAHLPSLGLDLARARQPDLILLDINMPDMDGFKVLKQFQADPQLCDIPVVAVTANAMARDIERGKAAGFSDYVTKPIEIGKFVRLIDSYLSN